MKNLKILFVSPEAVPFAKTGGLADVVGSLPVSLKTLGIDVRLVLPYYRKVKEGGLDLNLLLKNVEVPLGQRHLTCNVLETTAENGIPVYFIEREDLYDRPNLYGNSGGDYYDNLERFVFFSYAVLRLILSMGFLPDTVHCHDWQTALVPVLLKGPPGDSWSLAKTSTVFTIHNMGYQGIFPADKMHVTGLPFMDFFHSEGLEYWGGINLLKAGIVYSDAVTTVSPAYAKEIQTPEFGMGLEGVLQSRSSKVYGILNGIDYGYWNPARDLHIAEKYSSKKITGKRVCKESLILELNLDKILKKRPLLGMISRLDKQKGLDLLINILDKILDLDLGLVVLGSGDEAIQDSLKETVGRHPGKAAFITGINEPLAHHIMAGADMLLIPSRYEPCGLTQMYALKYGTVPVVRATGGLDDTVTNFLPEKGIGNGFKFKNYEPEALLNTIEQALKFYGNKKIWRKIMLNGMKEEFSWDRSAQKYLDLYLSLQESRSI